MAADKIDGLGVALITPFKIDLSVDYVGLDKVIEHIISGGADYIVVLGTTGETPTLSEDEKQNIISHVRTKVAGRVPLVIGIGGNNTFKVVEDIRTIDLNGYEAILSVAPYYNKPTQEGIYLHYMEICKVSPLPVILYNVPGRTGINISVETIRKLTQSTDKIYAIKEASGKIDQAEEIIKETHPGFKVISGDDALIFDLMKKGASGVISVLANAFPSKVKELVDLCKKGNFEEAENLQKSLIPLIGHLFADGNPAGVKAILSKMGLIENILRLPLVPVSKAIEEKLDKEATELLSL